MMKKGFVQMVENCPESVIYKRYPTFNSSSNDYVR